jgi:flagellar biosynthesis/type III secretory pathway chaperone
MDSNMTELIRLLADNERAMEEMALALAEEQECIVERDLERLGENTRRKEELTTRLARLQKECAESLRRTSDERGMAGNRFLSPLVAAAASSEQAQLRPLQTRLVRLATAVERQHKVNRRLLEASLEGIKGCMALFGRVLGGCDTYGARGAVTCGMAQGSILRREI